MFFEWQMYAIRFIDILRGKNLFYFDFSNLINS